MGHVRRKLKVIKETGAYSTNYSIKVTKDMKTELVNNERKHKHTKRIRTFIKNYLAQFMKN